MLSIRLLAPAPTAKIKDITGITMSRSGPSAGVPKRNLTGNGIKLSRNPSNPTFKDLMGAAKLMITKPSLYRGDYYTKEEYDLLRLLISKDKHVIVRLLETALEEKGPGRIKRKVNSILLPTKYPVGLAIYGTPLELVPTLMHVWALTSICQWRFQINK